MLTLAELDVDLVEDLLGQERATVGIVSQRDASVDEPGFAELFEVGTPSASSIAVASTSRTPPFSVSRPSPKRE